MDPLLCCGFVTTLAVVYLRILCIPLTVTYWIYEYIWGWRKRFEWPYLRALSLWDWFRDSYLSCRVFDIDSESRVNSPLKELGNDVPTLYACYPHATFPIAPFIWFCCSSLATKRPIVFMHKVLFITPVVAQFMTWMGGRSATRDSIRSVLKANDGTAAVLVPEGARGGLHKSPDKVKRVGFLKIAYETGARVVICYTPSEYGVFWAYAPQTGFLAKVRAWTHSKIGFPFPIFWAGPFPQQRLTTYVAECTSPDIQKETLEQYVDRFYATLDKTTSYVNDRDLV